MELVKSKGLVIFILVVLGVTLISSIGTKRYDDNRESIDSTYISYNLK